MPLCDQLRSLNGHRIPEEIQVNLSRSLDVDSVHVDHRVSASPSADHLPKLQGTSVEELPGDVLCGEHQLPATVLARVDRSIGLVSPYGDDPLL